MIDFLYSIDVALFGLVNRTIANPVTDIAMPILTNLNQTWWGLTLYCAAWLLLMVKGGRKGRTLGILLIPLIVMSDQISSNTIKSLVMRPRPCHTIHGAQVIEHIRMLVPCGSGFSFPSSHAVNNFAVASFMSYYYRRWMWAWMTFASLVGISRISVGVHYPSDILGGAIIGAIFAAIVIVIWNVACNQFPALRFFTPSHSARVPVDVEQP